MGQILRNHIGTKREFKTFYKKSIGVLTKIISDNIKKKGLKIKIHPVHYIAILKLVYGDHEPPIYK